MYIFLLILSRSFLKKYDIILADTEKNTKFSSTWGTIKIVVRGKIGKLSNYGINEDGIPVNVLTKSLIRRRQKNEKL
jgi:hypothetical protein